MSRYQHPPVETLLGPIDHLITARVAEIRQAYRDAAGVRTFPDLETLWTSAVADVRAALDIADPPATDLVRVPLIGSTRDEQPRGSADGPTGNGDADLAAVAAAHGVCLGPDMDCGRHLPCPDHP